MIQNKVSWVIRNFKRYIYIYIYSIVTYATMSSTNNTSNAQSRGKNLKSST